MTIIPVIDVILFISHSYENSRDLKRYILWAKKVMVSITTDYSWYINTANNTILLIKGVFGILLLFHSFAICHLRLLSTCNAISIQESMWRTQHPETVYDQRRTTLIVHCCSVLSSSNIYTIRYKMEVPLLAGRQSHCGIARHSRRGPMKKATMYPSVGNIWFCISLMEVVPSSNYPRARESATARGECHPYPVWCGVLLRRGWGALS